MATAGGGPTCNQAGAVTLRRLPDKGRERCMIWPKLPLGTSAGVLQGGKERTKRGKSCCVTFQERVAETFLTLFLRLFFTLISAV